MRTARFGQTYNMYVLLPRYRFFQAKSEPLREKKTTRPSRRTQRTTMSTRELPALPKLTVRTGDGMGARALRTRMCKTHRPRPRNKVDPYKVGAAARGKPTHARARRGTALCGAHRQRRQSPVS